MKDFKLKITTYFVVAVCTGTSENLIKSRGIINGNEEMPYPSFLFGNMLLSFPTYH